MCRLFGFRSVIPSKVHRSLISCDNALLVQSEAHPDGWGVAYYVGGVPHVVKSAESAVADSLFQRVSGVVSSQTVLAHLRKATTGQLSMINCHPFQYGRWVFAHNGQVPDFERHREALEAPIAPVLRRFILGQTDSEVLFYLLLTRLAAHTSLGDPDPGVQALAAAMSETVEHVHDVVGERCYESAATGDLYLSFLLTNGEAMVSHQGGKELFYSTHKSRCAERDTCSSYADICEMAVDSGRVNHLIVSSEPLAGENIWTEMTPGEIVAVDRGMRFSKQRSGCAGG